MTDSRFVGYHKAYRLTEDNDLVEYEPAQVPRAGTVARQLATLREQQADLNRRLSSAAILAELESNAPVQAGVYPLTVTEFTCSCEGDDEDGTAAQLTSRLGNLKVITEVPFMRKGNIVFAIRSQGLVDPVSGAAESVDALFQGGIYWRGTVSEERYDYSLMMFRSGKDQFVGEMTESINLTRKLGDINPDIYQAEVAYHLSRESDDASGRPTLSRSLADYASAADLDEVEHCYIASAAFSQAVGQGRDDLPQLAEAARTACAAVPGKRYYQAYDAYLEGFRYSPRPS